jgi:hypothetical protein
MDATKLGGVRCYHFAAIVVTAGRAHVMGTLQFAAVFALGMRASRNGVMRTTHVATGLGDLLLGNSHFPLLSILA